MMGLEPMIEPFSRGVYNYSQVNHVHPSRGVSFIPLIKMMIIHLFQGVFIRLSPQNPWEMIPSPLLSWSLFFGGDVSFIFPKGNTTCLRGERCTQPSPPCNLGDELPWRTVRNDQAECQGFPAMAVTTKLHQLGFFSGEPGWTFTPNHIWEMVGARDPNQSLEKNVQLRWIFGGQPWSPNISGT